MDDLLTIDYSDFNNISLIGIDLDNKSLPFARKNAVNHNKADILSLNQQNAWDLGTEAQYNIILK